MKPSSYPFGEPGGHEHDPEDARVALRADLCQIATEINFQWGAKIVDAILIDHDVKKKPRYKRTKKKEDTDVGTE